MAKHKHHHDLITILSTGVLCYDTRGAEPSSPLYDGKPSNEMLFVDNKIVEGTNQSTLTQPAGIKLASARSFAFGSSAEPSVNAWRLIWRT